ncbi:MAG TPA: hypothetical protein PLH97_00210 [Verrucomicrobiota bacterium]|nr:hypothetical protein [Verrucomicrobiota bacterium]
MPEQTRTAKADPASRPTRIAAAGQTVITLLLLAAFVSGALVWWGKRLQLQEGVSPSWLLGALVVHGSLNPALCALFGYLLCHHIRVGWQMRANLLSGFFMEAVFAGQILTGVGLYYAGSEAFRGALSSIHSVLGVLLPVGLAWHWWSGLRWARRQAEAGRT